jgi:hypothetical protein
MTAVSSTPRWRTKFCKPQQVGAEGGLEGRVGAAAVWEERVLVPVEEVGVGTTLERADHAGQRLRREGRRRGRGERRTARASSGGRADHLDRAREPARVALAGGISTEKSGSAEPADTLARGLAAARARRDPSPA